MHTAEFSSLEQVVRHYNEIPETNANLDERLRPQGRPQNLNMSDTEINQIVAFLGTLTGSDVYTNELWSDPFVN